ncbi:hypothetical protein GCM10017556_47520 [Micromonospora sagamiensis]|uniref:Uncharacterized protein n=1 Tax=Micromonospora sagamiensis TaxID=47875 RepID=A0A562WI22_9ACTN|nr:hypothetical protein JD81_03491 [Micromonospora sagamiensis]BCL17013.1 hypothetical protein GCM10017556_47520 [Micromonospora sagamiensis]
MRSDDRATAPPGPVVSAPFRPGPPAGTPRPGPPTGGPRPAPPAAFRPGPPDQETHPADGDDAVRHPAVDAAVRAIANAAALAPADQIPHYEAAYQTLRETLATIDQT